MEKGNKMIRGLLSVYKGHYDFKEGLVYDFMEKRNSQENLLVYIREFTYTGRESRLDETDLQIR